MHLIVTYAQKGKQAAHTALILSQQISLVLLRDTNKRYELLFFLLYAASLTGFFLRVVCLIEDKGHTLKKKGKHRLYLFSDNHARKRSA